MEPSQIFGGEEECQSSESGWTMYIGSPIDDDGQSDNGQSDDGGNDNRDGEGTTQADPEDESDDSMASDASSGPSHYGNNNPWGYGDGKGGYGLADFQQVVEVEEEYDEENKCCLDKKANKTLEKQMEGKKVEKKEMIFMDGKGKSPAQGGGKVRKNYWVGKRK